MRAYCGEAWWSDGSDLEKDVSSPCDTTKNTGDGSDIEKDVSSPCATPINTRDQTQHVMSSEPNLFQV